MTTTEPRVWRDGDGEPQDKPTMRDGRPGAGFVWRTNQQYSGMWMNECDQWVTWPQLTRWYEPLTEVLPAVSSQVEKKEGETDRGN